MKCDCLFISDSLNLEHVSSSIVSNRFRGSEDFNEPMFLRYQDYSSGCLIPINSFANDCISKAGIIKARKQFLSALEYAVDEFDVKIVLLAASTKRLFGKHIELKVSNDGLLVDSGFTLSELFPNIIFTNGDNGTALILNQEIDFIIEKAGIASKNNSLLINGLGLLGLDSLEHIFEKNLNNEQIIVCSNHTKDLHELLLDRNIRIFPNMSAINHNETTKITGIVNCTHNPASLISAENLRNIQNGQPIYVVDVAVPYGFPEEEFKKCRNVYRQDGGNAFIENGLEFYFNPQLCGLVDNVLYGCFAETLSISAFLNDYPEEIDNIRSLDLLNVNKATKIFVKKLFENYGIGIAKNPLSYKRCLS